MYERGENPSDWEAQARVRTVRVYSQLTMDVAQKIYEEKYADQGGIWSAVKTKDVWYDKADKLIDFIQSYPST